MLYILLLYSSFAQAMLITTFSYKVYSVRTFHPLKGLAIPIPHE